MAGKPKPFQQQKVIARCLFVGVMLAWQSQNRVAGTEHRPPRHLRVSVHKHREGDVMHDVESALEASELARNYLAEVSYSSLDQSKLCKARRVGHSELLQQLPGRSFVQENATLLLSSDEQSRSFGRTKCPVGPLLQNWKPQSCSDNSNNCVCFLHLCSWASLQPGPANRYKPPNLDLWCIHT